jgi:outer membrane protein insertion porin family
MSQTRMLPVALLLCILAVPAGLSAQAPVVTAVEFAGLRAVAEETLLYYLGLEVGAPLDRAVLNQNIHELWQRRLIDDIEIEEIAEPGGVRLRIEVVERPVIRSLTYEGLKRLSVTDINERILKDRIAVREGDPLSLGELHRLKATLEEMYREKGYRFAEAKYSLEEITPGERRVVFTIDEADKVKIANIEFEGNSVFRDRRLRWTMKKTRESGPLSRLMKRDVYNPATMREDLEAVRKLYRGAGYKNVVVGEPELEVRALRPDAPSAKNKKRRLFIDVPVEEGERWKFGEISIEGNELFTDEALLTTFRQRRAGRGWLRSKAVDDAVEKISEAYRNSGFIYSQITTELREREGNVADVIVHVSEGDQYKVGRLEFEGNTRTRDKVLRREFRVHEGMFLNMGALKNSLFKLNQLGYFKLNEDDPIKFENFDTDKKTVDLMVQGEESDRTELQFGGGWSEVDGFFGQFSLRTQNFLGRGESVGVSYQSGRIRDLFDLSYYVPWFLDRPQSVGIQAFMSEQDFSLLTGQRFLQNSEGAVLSYGRSLGLFGSFSVSYTRSALEDRRTFTDIPVGTEPASDQICVTRVADGVLTQDCERDSSSIRPFYVYDSRDNRLEPTVGRRLSVSLEYAGGVLGGNTYFYRPEIAASIFKPLTRLPLRTVAAVNLEAGMIEPFEGRELYPFDRYLLGGERSLRGFRYRQVWVRDEDGRTVIDEFGFPLGGDKYFQANVEYHLLLTGPFRLVLFTDFGNVYGEDQSWELGRLRYSAGAEMRIFVPVFGAPLRFIYAKNLDPLPDDRFESFQFSIGTSF